MTIIAKRSCGARLKTSAKTARCVHYKTLKTYTYHHALSFCAFHACSRCVPQVNVMPYFSPSAYRGYGDDPEGFYAVYARAFDSIFQ